MRICLIQLARMAFERASADHKSVALVASSTEGHQATNKTERVEQLGQTQDGDKMTDPRSMDGVSTVRIGSIGLNEQKNGDFWARLGPLEMNVSLFAEAIPAQPATEPTDELPAMRATPATPRLYVATVEDDGDALATALGETPQDAATAATAELLERLGSLAEILGLTVEEAA